MQAKQGSIQVGLWAGAGEDLAVGMASLQGEVWLHPRVGIDANIGLQRNTRGDINPRDASIHAVIRAMNTPTAVVNIRPGVSIPTGGVGNAFSFTPLSTASFDPRLTVDAALGSTWLVLPSAFARVPLYKGWDQQLQGPFVRGDLRFARRLGAVVPWAGMSVSHQAAGRPIQRAPAMSEGAATVGAWFAIGEKWGVSTQFRAPVWISGAATRVWSGAVAVRYVIRANPKDEH